MEKAQLSIVIPVYNNWWLTERCLKSLGALRGSSGVAFETIVVDNASSDETPRAIARFPWVRSVRHEENRNFAGACNAGARAAHAPLTLFLNNDAYPLGDALGPLVRAFERREVAIAGGALFFEDGATQAAGLVMLRNAHWHYFCRNLPVTLHDVGRSREALGVSGAAMAVRTAWFVENGGFDESYVNGFEDVDLCLRARREDRSVAYVADARFAHYEAASAGRFAREAENERRFYGRWSSALAALPRTQRGSVGAISIAERDGAHPLLDAALADLEAGLRGFGHPIAHGPIPMWRRLDDRFRHAATLAWFTNAVSAPGVTISGDGSSIATIRTQGAATFEVPWLPCAGAARVASVGVVRSEDPECVTVGLAGGDDEDAARLAGGGATVVRITPRMLLGYDRIPVACVVHLGLTDASAFGNVLLAQAGVPSVVLASEALRALFQPDVALVRERNAIAQAVLAILGDPTGRARYGALVAGDARRRFSPRRSAIRVVDLLCAARFGPERSARAHSNAP